MFPGANGPGSRAGSQAESETGRLEAFSDGVLAVIITIMALELRAPVDGSFTDLRARPRATTPMKLGGVIRQHV